MTHKNQKRRVARIEPAYLLTDEQAEALLAHSPSDRREQLQLALLGGLRAGELRTTRWSAPTRRGGQLV